MKEIGEKVLECEIRLKDLGPALPVDAKDKMHIVWEKIQEFTDNYKNSISGKYDSRREKAINSDLSGGAVIKMMFSELYEDMCKGNYKVIT